jgi:methyl-accepting chemotaxis protein
MKESFIHPKARSRDLAFAESQHYFCLTYGEIPLEDQFITYFSHLFTRGGGGVLCNFIGDTMPRKKHIIDKKFQLRMTFRILGIIIIAFILVIAITGIISTDNNRQISATINDLNRSMAKDKKTIELFIASGGLRKDTAADRDHDRIIEEHLESMALMHTNMQQLNKILNQNRIIMTVMIVTGILLGIGLFVYLIRLTNRISGPLYVLTQHMNDIMKGKKPNLRALRKNDEFQDFYHQFITFIEGLLNKK